MKNELSGRIIVEFAALRPKTHSYLIDDDDDDDDDDHDDDKNKKVEATKKSVIKRILKLEDYKHFLEAT